MKYNSQLELYHSLLPVLKVKKRLLSITSSPMLTIQDVWTYLSMVKWRYSHDLTLADIINDIITVSVDDINVFLGGKK